MVYERRLGEMAALAGYSYSDSLRASVKVFPLRVLKLDEASVRGVAGLEP